ncbi:MAG: hypothetical protein ACOY35_11420 [Bacillota bacterium]
MSYHMLQSSTDILALKNKLPEYLRKSIMEIIDSDTTSRFYYKIYKAGYNFHVFLIEQNESENYTICHCFSSDIIDKASQNFTYESMALTNAVLFTQLASAAKIT